MRVRRNAYRGRHRCDERRGRRRFAVTDKGDVIVTDRLGLQAEIFDADTLGRAVEHCKEGRVALPTFAQLADPGLIPTPIREALAGIGPDEAHPLNLFRVHWRNGADRVTPVDVPEHVVLPRELTGVE